MMSKHTKKMSATKIEADGRKANSHDAKSGAPNMRLKKQSTILGVKKRK